MTPTELREEMEQVWQSPGVACRIHFTRWRTRIDYWDPEEPKLISARGKMAIARNSKRAK